MRAEEFDQKFDDGEDVAGDLDLAALRRPALEQRRVNVDFPSWMIESLDREARRLGVTRGLCCGTLRPCAVCTGRGCVRHRPRRRDA
jgi:hypothetical protein